MHDVNSVNPPIDELVTWTISEYFHGGFVFLLVLKKLYVLICVLLPFYRPKI